ncbi:hypothetical protein VNI00_005479 [Paramarasmius palmivorus]|uniref:Uncharacterized protein n=1 Tax=Paramarasmius palmivorus TaxID=297713 RepID=A0AAW0DDL1_9AGAR
MENSFIPDRKSFSSTHSALQSLEKLGNPPKTPDISYPSTQCQSALDSLAFLTYHNTTSWNEEAYFKNVVLKHWPNAIGIWCRYFLESVLGEEGSNTQNGIDFRDRIVWTLPDLIPFCTEPLDHNVDRVLSLFQVQGRFLVSLSAKLWLKLLDYQHPATFKWGDVTLGLMYAGEPKLLNELNAIFVSSTDMVGLCVRTMFRFAMLCRFSVVDLDTLLGFNTFMIIISPCFYPSATLHGYFLACGGVKAVVTALLGLSSGPTLLQYHESSIKGFTDGLTIVRICMSLLRQCLNYPSDASEALEAGLLKAVVKLTRYYDNGKAMDSDHWDRNLGDMVAEVLQRISRLLVYRSVLCRFNRSSRKLFTREWEELVGDHGRLSSVWDALQDNAETLNETHDILNPSLCDYDQAKGKEAPDSIDSAIFGEIIEIYISFFEKKIFERLEAFKETHSDSRPVLVLQFDRVEDLNTGHLMHITCFEIVDYDEIIEDERFLEKPPQDLQLQQAISSIFGKHRLKTERNYDSMADELLKICEIIINENNVLKRRLREKDSQISVIERNARDRAFQEIQDALTAKRAVPSSESQGQAEVNIWDRVLGVLEVVKRSVFVGPQPDSSFGYLALPPFFTRAGSPSPPGDLLRSSTAATAAAIDLSLSPQKPGSERSPVNAYPSPSPETDRTLTSMVNVAGPSRAPSQTATSGNNSDSGLEPEVLSSSSRPGRSKSLSETSPLTTIPEHEDEAMSESQPHASGSSTGIGSRVSRAHEQLQHEHALDPKGKKRRHQEIDSDVEDDEARDPNYLDTPSRSKKRKGMICDSNKQASQYEIKIEILGG